MNIYGSSSISMGFVLGSWTCWKCFQGFESKAYFTKAFTVSYQRGWRIRFPHKSNHCWWRFVFVDFFCCTCMHLGENSPHTHTTYKHHIHTTHTHHTELCYVMHVSELGIIFNTSYLISSCEVMFTCLSGVIPHIHKSLIGKKGVGPAKA